MKSFLKFFLILNLLNRSLSQTVNISCTASSLVSSSRNCIVSGLAIPVGSPVNYGSNMDRNLSSLNFNGCKLTRLPPNIFTNFTQMTGFITRFSGLKIVMPTDFKGASKVNIMDIQSNNFLVLRNGVFRNMPLLQLLTISYNSIAKIGVNAFTGLSNLVYIIMDNNQLTGFPIGVFAYLKSLTCIVLTSNRLTSIPKTLFR